MKDKENDKVNLLATIKDKKQELRSVQQVAEDLGISPSSVYRYIDEGKIKAYRRGTRNILVLESSVEEYLKSLNPLLISD